MRTAIVSEDINMCNEIKGLLELDSDEYDQYINFDDFKSCYMLCYDFLILQTTASKSISSEEMRDIKKYCSKKGIRFMLYDSDTNSELKEEPVEDISENMQNDDPSPDTVELRPSHSNKHSGEVDKIEVIKTVYSNAPQINICIGSLSRKAGSTFITLNLARALSELNILVSVIELPLNKPYIFDYIGLQQRFQFDKSEVNDFQFIEDILKNTESKRKKELVQDNIIWFILNPFVETIDNLNFDSISKILYASKRASVNLIDIGNHLEHPAVKEHLDSFNKILIIVDPLPPDILQNEKMLKFIQKIKAAHYPVEFIINKYHKSIYLKELNQYLGFAPLMQIPFIDSGLIYKAVYQCKVPYSMKGIKASLKKEMDLLIKKNIPDAFIKENKARGLKNILTGNRG